MDIGIGLPNTIRGTDAATLLAFARRADQAGFSSLGTVDRLVYSNYEPLVALSAAAAVTERIRLATAVLNAPYRINTPLLAKQLASLDVLAEGRLWVGIGLGAREDDYVASGASLRTRGKTLDEQLRDMKDIWAGEAYRGTSPIGPQPVTPGGPEVVVGGGADVAYERAARYGSGWIMGGGAPDQFAAGAAKMDAAWERAGRDGSPEKKSLAYFSLGDRAAETAQETIGHYYAWLGEEVAGMIIGGTATTPDMVKSYVEAFGEAGCTELVWVPSSSDPAQVDLLAQAVGKG
jgi:alkanesulfonate monooxygenase SsuD/methylene tetrahydromethanopterin reductase-like flavin-dependent oxidoreductase (luciferase family)